MKSITSISDGRLPAMVRTVEQGEMVTVTRRNEPVAVLVGYDWLTSMIETMEFMANPEAMKAIRDAEEGKTKSYRLEDIPA
jgi:antitoxin YefM